MLLWGAKVDKKPNTIMKTKDIKIKGVLSLNYELCMCALKFELCMFSKFKLYTSLLVDAIPHLLPYIAD